MSPDPTLEPTVPGEEPEEVDEGEESDEYEVEVCILFSDISSLVLIFCASELALVFAQQLCLPPFQLLCRRFTITGRRRGAR
jgi:hypothetical protein